MPCPFFEPVRPRTCSPEARTATLPLGDTWDGICRADPAQSYEPDDGALRLCNLGYARHQCVRFPHAEDSPDAARFAIRRDDAEQIAIYYVLERNHYPLAHGPLAWSRREGAFTSGPASILVRQAGAYVASYLRRKGEAPGR